MGVSAARPAALYAQISFTAATPRKPAPERLAYALLIISNHHIRRKPAHNTMFKVILLLAAIFATAHADCSLSKVLYNPAPVYSLGKDSVDQDITCGKGSQELIATDWTVPYSKVASGLLTKFLFPSLRGDDKDVYDCGSAGIKKANVKGIAGCLKKGIFHGEVGIDYVCNQQARTRSVTVDATMKLKGNC